MKPVVISDAGPLIGLARIRRLELLGQLFQRVLIPPAVEAECCHNRSLPGALQILQSIQNSFIEVVPDDGVPGLSVPTLLDRGEVSAIALALHLGHRLWIDDLRARTFARTLNIPIVGTGGVLLQAKQQGIIPSIRETLEELRSSGYRLSSALVNELLRRADE